MSKPFSQPLFGEVGLKVLPISQMTKMEAQRVPVTCPWRRARADGASGTSLSCLLCPSPTPEGLMEDEEPSGPACRGRPGAPSPRASLPRPRPPARLGGGSRGTDSELDSFCMPRMAVRAWLGPGGKGSRWERNEWFRRTLPASNSTSRGHTVASPETWPRRPGAPLPSQLLSPRPPASASSPGTGTQPWGVRALTILGLGDGGQPGLRSSTTGRATGSATRAAGRLARPDGHF